MGTHAASGLTNRQYDTLKKGAQVVLPAAGALYFTLAQIWGLPNAEEVVGTIAAVNTFLGVVVGLAGRSYNNSPDRFDGGIDVNTQPDGKVVYSLELNDDPEKIQNMDRVVFKVNKG